MTPTLKDPENRLDRKAIAWWMLQSTALFVPILVVIAAVGWFFEATRPYLPFSVALAVVLWAVGLLVEPFWRFRVHRWQATGTAVYNRTGWIVREWRAAPLSRIQTVDATQGPIEQLLGLSTLTITTASSNGAVEIGGLSKDIADRVAVELTEIAELTEGDAT